MQFYGYSVEKIPKIPCFRLKIGPKWSKSANFTKIDTFRQFPGGLGGNQQFFQAQFWSLFQVRVVVGGCFWTRNGSKRPKTVENGPKMAKTTPFYSLFGKLIRPHFGTLCIRFLPGSSIEEDLSFFSEKTVEHTIYILFRVEF